MRGPTGRRRIYIAPMSIVSTAIAAAVLAWACATRMPVRAAAFPLAAIVHSHQTAHSPTAQDCNGQAADATRSVSVPGRPFGTALTLDGCWLFVSIDSPNPRQSGGVAVFQRLGNANITLKRVVPIPNGLSGLVVTHDGKLLIAAGGEFVVFFDVQELIGGTRDPIVGYISDGGSAGSVYVNVTPDDRTLFVSDESQYTITVIDLLKARSNGFQGSAIVGKISVGGAPIALTFSPDARLLYTTSEAGLKTWNWPDRCKPEVDNPVRGPVKIAEGAIIVVDVDRARVSPDKAVVARVPAGCSPVRLALDATGESAWVTVRSDNAVAGFDTHRLLNDPEKARIASVEVGKAPVGLMALRGGQFLVATNSDRFSKDQTASTFVVIDTTKISAGSSAVAATRPAGVFPREFSQSPDGATLFLTNYRSNNLQVIDARRLLAGIAERK